MIHIYQMDKVGFGGNKSIAILEIDRFFGFTQKLYEILVLFFTDFSFWISIGNQFNQII